MNSSLKTTALAAALSLSVVLNFAQTQESLPPPTLIFDQSVNVSDIQLFSTVKLLCTPPDRAPYPMRVSLGHWPQALLTSDPLRWANTMTFTVRADWGLEGEISCWYNVSQTGQASPLSNTFNLSISSLSPPTASIQPILFSVGGNYTVSCQSPPGPFPNYTMSLLSRPLPVVHGDELFEPIGSLTLRGEGSGITYSKVGASGMVEYACNMELSYGGRILRSPLSNQLSAIAEEMPVLLWHSNKGQGCMGRLEVKVRGQWLPVCQGSLTSAEDSKFDLAVAGVVCKELSCGKPIGWKKVYNVSMGRSALTIGPVRCGGTERRIRECPVDDYQICSSRSTLHIMCSDALPPPRLSVAGFESRSTVYVRSNQSVKISCHFDSDQLHKYDGVYVSLRFLPKDLIYTSQYVHPGGAMVTELRSPVQEGKYVCFAEYRGTLTGRSDDGDSVIILRYDPPDAGPIVAGVITTVIGVGILIYLFVFRVQVQKQQGAQESSTYPETNTESVHTPTAGLQGEPETTATVRPQ